VWGGGQKRKIKKGNLAIKIKQGCERCLSEDNNERKK
jgi:hypothetical protein